MKSKTKILPFLLGILFFFTYCEKENDDSLTILGAKKSDIVDGRCFVVQDLYAGAGQNDLSKGTFVGQVHAEIIDDELIVMYNVNSPWVLSETHLWVGTEIDKKSFPKNASPGQFPYKHDLSMVTEDMFTVPLGDIDPEVDQIFIAAHGVVNYGPGSLMDLCASLPESIEFEITEFPGSISYNILNISGNSIISGDQNGWCIEPETHIPGWTTFSADVVCGYGDIPEGTVDYPENLDLANWVINQGFIGQSSDCGGEYTSGDIQTALWMLLSTESDLNLDQGNWSQCRVDEILAAANANGEGYTPECGDLLLILLVPEGGLQNLAFGFPIGCGGDETIWAFGDNTFIANGISKKWGWIFDMDCTVE